VEIVDINLFKKKCGGVDVRMYAFLSLPRDQLLRPLLPLRIYPALVSCFKRGSQNLPGGLRETTRNDCENNRSPARKSNLGPTEFYARLLTTQQLRDDEPLRAAKHSSYTSNYLCYPGSILA
jgi:hypothetical protein